MWDVAFEIFIYVRDRGKFAAAPGGMLRGGRASRDWFCCADGQCADALAANGAKHTQGSKYIGHRTTLDETEPNSALSPKLITLWPILKSAPEK